MSIYSSFVNGYWVHDLSKFVPFLHYQEKFGVRYYGLAYVLGFVGAAWMLRRYAKAGRSLVPAAEVMDLLFYLMLGVFLGGRIGWFVLYHPALLIEDPLSLIRVWDGGMASHGGFLGVTLALLLYARRKKIPLFHLADLIVTTAPFGLLLGRIANFINGELWGKIATVPWAVIFPDSAPGLPIEQIPPRHPSQLYEAVLEGALLLAIMQWRFWKSDVSQRQPGRIAGEFLILYAMLRAVGEIFREPDADLILGLSRGTFYSVFLIIAGILVIVWSRRGAPLWAPAGGHDTSDHSRMKDGPSQPPQG